MTCFERWLGLIANLAAIITGGIALFFYFRDRLERRAKRVRLENYLKREKAKGVDAGQRTILHLVRHVGMSASDVYTAASKSKRIQVRTMAGKAGYADRLLFEHDGD